MINGRTVVCLLGSTRFKSEFEKANADESAAGKVVLTICWFTHADGSLGKDREKVYRDLHFDKILLADECLVLNVGGYVGAHTAIEVDYARTKGKNVRWLEPVWPHRDASSRPAVDETEQKPPFPLE